MSRYKHAHKELDMSIRSVSPQNRAHFQDWIARKRNQGTKPTTLCTYAAAFRKLDAFFAGRDLAMLSEHDLVAYVSWLHEHLSPSTVHKYAGDNKPILAFFRGERTLSADLAAALTTRTPERGPPPDRLISESEFEAFMQELVQAYHDKHPVTRLLVVALYRALWSFGLRAEELLCLNVGSLHFPDEHGVRATMPDVDGLKTGPRQVASVEAAKALKAWLAVHPEPRSYSLLFIGLRDRTGRKRLDYTVFHKRTIAIAEAAGLNVGRSKRVTPHCFRHSCATLKVRKHNWGEAKLRSFFGWKPGSTMPSHYVHLANGGL